MPAPAVPHRGTRYVWEGREAGEPSALLVSVPMLGKHISFLTPPVCAAAPQKTPVKTNRRPTACWC